MLLVNPSIGFFYRLDIWECGNDDAALYLSKKFANILSTLSGVVSPNCFFLALLSAVTRISFLVLHIKRRFAPLRAPLCIIILVQLRFFKFLGLLATVVNS